MVTRSPLYERDLALPVKDYLRAEGWTLYEEVSFSGKTADIIAERDEVGGSDLAAVELKTSFGLPVIAQARNWQAHAHLAWVAVPEAKLTPERSMALWVCESFGIGVLEVRRIGKLEEAAYARGEPLRLPRVQALLAAQPKYNRSVAPLRAALAPEHQTHAPAGTKTGVRWNATQAAYQRVRDYLTEAGGSALLELALRETSAPAFLRDHIARAVVPRVRLNGSDISAGVILELVEPGEEAPIYSARSLRTRRRA